METIGYGIKTEAIKELPEFSNNSFLSTVYNLGLEESSYIDDYEYGNE